MEAKPSRYICHTGLQKCTQSTDIVPNSSSAKIVQQNNWQTFSTFNYRISSTFMIYSLKTWLEFCRIVMLLICLCGVGHFFWICLCINFLWPIASWYEIKNRYKRKFKTIKTIEILQSNKQTFTIIILQMLIKYGTHRQS